MRFQSRRKKFRSVLNGDRCVYPGSVFDPISARIAENIGFEIGMFAGSIASFTVLGAPDVIVLTLTEFAQQAQRINRATELPLMVDADHGYGNALNVQRTVEELEMAGVSGMSIEDTELPQPFGSVGHTKLLSLSEGIGKMKSALDGRRDPNLVIAGRTSAPGVTGIDDAVERAVAYEKVGVDAIFLVGIKTREDLETVSNAIKLPIILGGGGPDMLDIDYLSSQKVRICLQGHQPFSAAVKAIHDTMKALREGTPAGELEGIASSELMKTVTRDKHYTDMFTKYLKD
ncbi:isocitrate lyase/phosphoenolpyruvate mutase family protein [Alphaproteobacteria bacterium]|nr:isocitrate lyase/phosphoenolpyruvate mutase family protein [Alphaproteobacteria bacterium]